MSEMTELTREQIALVKGILDDVTYTKLERKAVGILCDMSLAYLDAKADAARWRKARSILSVEDIEDANKLMLETNSVASEEENLRADAAIDAAMKGADHENI